MLILHAYQVNLLRHLDEGKEVSHDAIKELCQATDLSLGATKENALWQSW